MTVPKYEEIMLPLIESLGDGREYSLKDAVRAMREVFALTDEEYARRTPSGRQTLFGSRVGWAEAYLKQAGLIETTRRGRFRITSRGREVLKQAPERIDRRFLMRFKEFRDFVRPSSKDGKASPLEELQEERTPEEILDAAYRDLVRDLSSELLETVKTCSPAFFERLVVDVLLAMGYGGSFDEAGRSVGRSGDGGIDGVIHEDRLGLDRIYLQAKRWENPVGRPEIQKFVGALQGKDAGKGVFITTSDFTQEARRYAEQIGSRIVLVDGRRLAELMIESGVGVTTSARYELKRIDSDYFQD